MAYAEGSDAWSARTKAMKICENRLSNIEYSRRIHQKAPTIILVQGFFTLECKVLVEVCVDPSEARAQQF